MEHKIPFNRIKNYDKLNKNLILSVYIFFNLIKPLLKNMKSSYLLGLDSIFDETSKCYLLECNYNPTLQSKGYSYNMLVKQMLINLIKLYECGSDGNNWILVKIKILNIFHKYLMCISGYSIRHLFWDKFLSILLNHRVNNVLWYPH